MYLIIKFYFSYKRYICDDKMKTISIQVKLIIKRTGLDFRLVNKEKNTDGTAARSG